MYNGIIQKLHGFERVLNSNEMVVIISLKSMEQEHQDEVWIQEIYSFIGTVGGSLGLFIGFSYTGFVGKILDYFIQDY